MLFRSVLYVVMANVALPRVGEVLKTRADKISGDLDRATALKAESDQAIATYEKALADARAQAATVSRDTAATAECPVASIGSVTITSRSATSAGVLK